MTRTRHRSEPASTRRQRLEIAFPRRLRLWGRRWNAPHLEERVRIEWSGRFRRGLGRAYPARGVVRLSERLASVPLAVAMEVLCHEVAHLVAVGAGPGRPHGAEWASLVRAAGFTPRRRVPWPGAPRGPGRQAAPSGRRYLHRCPVCQTRRMARRPVPRWRCAACVAAGLEGRLDITVQA